MELLDSNQTAEQSNSSGESTNPSSAVEGPMVGGYRLLELVGEGGMGSVHRAEDVVLKRPVALKLLKGRQSQDDLARNRFLREAQAAAAVESDHIVRIYQVGESDSVPYLAMEFLRGQPLDRWMRNRPVPISDVLRYGRQIAEGLRAAHGAGLVHRDIKPSNLWLEAPQDRIKILDFGLARSASESGVLTSSGVVVGTPAYMSPEQARGQPVDHRCDLFSLGCVLYHLSAGQRPFTGTDTLSILSSLALDTPTAPATINADCPADLSDLIMKLLQKRAVDRPESAASVVRELDHIHRLWQEAHSDTFIESQAAVALAVERERRTQRQASHVLLGRMIIGLILGIPMLMIPIAIIYFFGLQALVVVLTALFAIPGVIMLWIRWFRENRKPKKTYLPTPNELDPDNPFD